MKPGPQPRRGTPPYRRLALFFPLYHPARDPIDVEGAAGGHDQAAYAFPYLADDHLSGDHLPGHLYLHHGKDSLHCRHEAHRRAQPGYSPPGDGEVAAVDHHRLRVRPGTHQPDLSPFSQDHPTGSGGRDHYLHRGLVWRHPGQHPGNRTGPKDPTCHGSGRSVMEILRIEGLSKIFGSGRLEVRALEEINLSVSAGDLVALLGPSGSGKTTMLLCTSLILEPTQRSEE